ncbi:MAG: YfiR family protein [Campylobacterales bacterium]|nr:YfiR family protein [Campylobacterales bacterium]
MKKIVVALLLTGLLLRVYASSQERDLQAVFVGRFAKFTQWPSSDKKFFHITLIGHNPFENLLDNLYKNKKIHGKPVKIRYITQIEEIGHTDILFITLENQKEIQKAIKYAIKNSILTISTQRGFAQRGGIIQLSFVMQKPHLVINHAAARYSRIKIKAPLLAIAKEIITGEM